ncbi:MAG: hypothetical protein ACXW2J_01045 [Allosphingosinicella sp.]
MFDQTFNNSARHPLDLDASDLSISVASVSVTRNNADDCFSSAATFSTAGGCAGCVSTFTSVVSCGS